MRFAVPTVANGRVYIGAKGEVDVYGLLPPSGKSPKPFSLSCCNERQNIEAANLTLREKAVHGFGLVIENFEAWYRSS